MNPTMKSMLALVLLLVYGSFIYTFNASVNTAHEGAARVRVRDGITDATAHADYPPELIRYEAEVWRGKRVIHLVNMSLMFLLFYAGLWPFLRKAMDRGILGVSERIRDAERRADLAGRDLEDAEAQLAKIDDDAATILERERATAEAEGDRLRDLARKEVEHIQAHAQLSVRRDEKRVQAKLLARVAERAMGEALEGISGDLDDATRTRLSEALVGGFEA